MSLQIIEFPTGIFPITGNVFLNLSLQSDYVWGVVPDGYYDSPEDYIYVNPENVWLYNKTKPFVLHLRLQSDCIYVQPNLGKLIYFLTPNSDYCYVQNYNRILFKLTLSSDYIYVEPKGVGRIRLRLRPQAYYCLFGNPISGHIRLFLRPEADYYFDGGFVGHIKLKFRLGSEYQYHDVPKHIGKIRFRLRPNAYYYFSEGILGKVDILLLPSSEYYYRVPDNLIIATVHGTKLNLTLESLIEFSSEIMSPEILPDANDLKNLYSDIEFIYDIIDMTSEDAIDIFIPLTAILSLTDKILLNIPMEVVLQNPRCADDIQLTCNIIPDPWEIYNQPVHEPKVEELEWV
jgi:hypothetical protein